MADTLVSPQPGPSAAPVIDCAAYCGGSRVADLGIDQIRPALARDDQFVWLGLYEPEQDVLRTVQKQFGLHDLAIEDAYHAHQRPKLELYEDSLFVVLRTAHMSSSARQLEFGETHIFVGHNYLVTVRHGSLRSHIPVRQRCESTPHLLSKGPGYVLYALMDFVVDQYLPVVQQIEEEVEELEDVIFGMADTGDATSRIYRLKRDLLSLRRAVTPLVEVCNRLMRFELPHIPEDTRVYFRDVYDHIVHFIESLESIRDMLGGMMDIYLSSISNRVNMEVRALTVVTMLFMPATLISGIFGMNFDIMPWLRHPNGFWFAIGLMGTIASIMGLIFWRRQWLSRR